VHRPAARAQALTPRTARGFDALLGWYFVAVWGSAYLASKLGLRAAAPFTFLSLRFAFGIACMVVIVGSTRPRWPQGRDEWLHVVVAGLLMHAGNLAGSHYAQYLGLSAGIVAVILATQPLLTALIVAARGGDRPGALQWTGIVCGLAGVALVVWDRIDLGGAMHAGALAAVFVSLLSITLGTLYQRRHCAPVGLRSAGLIQFVASFLVLAPAALLVEGFRVRWDWPLVGAIAYLVIFGSILAVNALHTLMRRGAATRVTSLLYLTPIVAVLLEWLLFGVVPNPLSIVGIVVTCLGLALVTRRSRALVAEVEG